MNNIVDSFACSFRHGNQSLLYQYGRVFILANRFIFASWTRKQLSLKWSDVVDIEPTHNTLNSQKDSFAIRCKSGTSEEACVILSGFYDRQKALDIIKKVRQNLTQMITPSSPPEDTSAVDVPPDDAIGKMHSILSQKLRNISIQRFYEIVWSEGNDTDEKPLYQPWLEKECFDVEVGDWQMEECTGPWCSENYTQKRVVVFKAKRKTHLYIGPPIAKITQVCRRG
jgi:hypothetical protein